MQGVDLGLIKACLVVAACMAVQDFTGTVLVVAEAKGRARLAGLMDSAGDVARAATASVTTEAILGGLGIHSAVILATLALTSFVVTSRTTTWSRKLKAGPVNPLPPE